MDIFAKQYYMIQVCLPRWPISFQLRCYFWHAEIVIGIKHVKRRTVSQQMQTHAWSTHWVVHACLCIAYLLCQWKGSNHQVWQKYQCNQLMWNVRDDNGVTCFHCILNKAVQRGKHVLAGLEYLKTLHCILKTAELRKGSCVPSKMCTDIALVQVSEEGCWESQDPDHERSTNHSLLFWGPECWNEGQDFWWVQYTGSRVSAALICLHPSISTCWTPGHLLGEYCERTLTHCLTQGEWRKDKRWFWLRSVCAVLDLHNNPILGEERKEERRIRLEEVSVQL